MSIASLLLLVVAAPPLTQSPLSPDERAPLPAGARGGPVIPGLAEDAVPQGLAWVPVRSGDGGDGAPRYLISHDRPGTAASCVSVLNADDAGALRAVVTLAEPDGSPHRGHVGGLAAAGGSLFVASDGRVLRFPLAPFLADAPPESVRALAVRQDETNADVSAARTVEGGEELWVGEFAYRSLIPFTKDYPTVPSHHLVDRVGVKKRAWIVRSDPADPTGRVTGVLSVRTRVQGVCFLPTADGTPGEVALSVSYGRTNDSTLAFYRDPTAGPPHRTVSVKGRDVPLWFLDAENHARSVAFPPMSEGIARTGGPTPRLAVLTESGARKFRSGVRDPLDRLALLPIPERGEPGDGEPGDAEPLFPSGSVND